MKKYGFTLIELIVVITILAILGTIAFISFKGFTGDARNSKIISDITTLHKGLTLYKTTASTVPMPDNAVAITSGITEITYEGEIGDNVRSRIKTSNEMKTPTGENYMYATNGNNKYFSLVYFLESEVSNLTTSVNAEGEKEMDFKGDDVLTVFDTDGTFVDSTVDIETLDYSSKNVLLGDKKIASKTEVPVAIKGNYKHIGEWNKFDSNCPYGDIIIGNQTWAGCNSTLGEGFERLQRDEDVSKGTYSGVVGGTYGCQDYAGNNDNTKCNTNNNNGMLSTANPKEYFDTVSVNVDKEYSTIWGKFYTWEKSNTACPSGRHVPSDTEWTTLEQKLGCSVSDANREGWGCGGLGWAEHNLKDNTNNVANALKIPLSGHRYSNGFTFYDRGRYPYLWTSTAKGEDAYGRFMYYGHTSVNRSARSQSVGFSVRCIKNH